MDFIRHTIYWIKGELFEASLISIFGIATLLAGLLFWRLGTSPNAKALFWPFLITGVIYTAIGVSMIFSNQRRQPQFEQSYRQDQAAFVKAEKKRVEDFQYGYTVSKIVATVFFAATLLIFWSTKNPTWQGIGIGLSLFALAGLVVDYFSQERADIYYKAIVQALRG